MTLFELFALLRKHLALVIALPIVAGIVAFVVSMFLPNEYTASTTMYVLSRDDAAATTAVTQQDLSAGQMLTNDVATLIKSDRVKKDVATKVGLASTTTRVITLEVTGTDPEMAALIANSTVEEISTVATEVMKLQSVNAIDAATPPTNPSGPRRLLIGVVGCLGGFMLAVAIVVLQDMLDTRVRSGDEAEAIMGVPVVGHFAAMDK